jgi:hypothetical protein
MDNPLKLYKKSIFLRRIVKENLGRMVCPHWKRYTSDIINQKTHSERNAKKPKILIATSTGGFWDAVNLESLLAVALTMRGADVDSLLCDGILGACQLCDIHWYSDVEQFNNAGPTADLCPGCFSVAQSVYGDINIPVHRYRQYVTGARLSEIISLSQDLEIKKIRNYSDKGVAVGEHALAGTLRFFARGDLDDEPFGERILRRYFKAALIATDAISELFTRNTYDCVVFHHGIYVPQGIIGEIARQKNIRVVNWVPAYRKKCFIFSHGDTYHHTLMNEPVSVWENLQLTPGMENEIMGYLHSRSQGEYDWITFHNNPTEDTTIIKQKLALDPSKPCIGLLTNVIWDAQLHYPSNAFPSMIGWVLKTISYFSKRPDLQLIIRIHPAEIRGSLPSRQRVADEITKAFPKLPNNIHLIKPDENISTYALMSLCQAALIYGTKMGVELTSLGIPVIVAGEAWIRNKGITFDASSTEEYFQILDMLPDIPPIGDETRLRARKYAYHFFFRRMIPVCNIHPTGYISQYQITVEKLGDLLQGNCQGLDIICNGILHGDAFIYPYENVKVTK